MVLGYEVAPDTGTPHIQGFITFKRCYRFSQLHKMFPTVHWEAAKCADAMNYCMKDNYEIEDNRLKKNSQAPAVLQDVASGMSVHDVLMKYQQFWRYPAQLTALRSVMLNRPRNSDVKPLVIWFYGSTGTGKTKSVVELSKDRAVGFTHAKGGNDISFEDWDFQEMFCIDELRASNCDFQFLLRVLDRYPFGLRLLYRASQWNPKIIFVTSPYSVTDLYLGRSEQDSIQQLVRRVDFCIECPVSASQIELLRGAIDSKFREYGAVQPVEHMSVPESDGVRIGSQLLETLETEACTRVESSHGMDEECLSDCEACELGDDESALD